MECDTRPIGFDEQTGKVTLGCNMCRLEWSTPITNAFVSRREHFVNGHCKDPNVKGVAAATDERRVRVMCVCVCVCM